MNVFVDGFERSARNRRRQMNRSARGMARHRARPRVEWLEGRKLLAADPSITTLAASPNPANVGEAIAFMATVTEASEAQPGGEVVFNVDGVDQRPAAGLQSVGGHSVATFVDANLSVGPHQIVAKYLGNPEIAPSASKPFIENVTSANLISTHITISAAPNPAEFLEDYVVTAIISAQGGTPKGTVTFVIDGQRQLPPSAVVVSNGRFVATVPADSGNIGPQTITAFYSGDAVFAPSVSKPITETVVEPPFPTTTYLSANPDPSVASQPVVFTAGVIVLHIPASLPGPTPEATGTVTFTVDGKPILPPSSTGVLVVRSFTPGTHVVTATYNGDAHTGGSSSNTVTVHVLDGPRVTGVQRFEPDAQHVFVVLFFDEPLDAARAQRIANYSLLTRGQNGAFGGPGSRLIPIAAAAYVAQFNAVVLLPAQHLFPNQDYQLTVNGVPPAGLADLAGRPLDGAGTGIPGSNFVHGV
jgi:hypothetical protein